jgi:VCBS repeat-containing protein
MRLSPRFVLASGLILALVAFFIPTALGGTIVNTTPVTISGTIDLTSNCYFSSTGYYFAYDATEFTVSATATYTVTLTVSLGGDIWLVLLDNTLAGFNPAVNYDSQGEINAGNGPFTVSLLAGHTYLFFADNDAGYANLAACQGRGAGDNRTYTVTINARPTAVNDSATVDPGGTVGINVVGNDTDSDGGIFVATVAIVTAPTCGTTTLQPVTLPGVVTYTNTDLTCTSDSFTYTVNDINGLTSNVATVSITLTNASPTANSDSSTIASGGLGAIDVLTNDWDIDGTLDPTTVTIFITPSCGTAVPDAVTGVVTYTNTDPTCILDLFFYTVNDNKGATSIPATVSITLTNIPPTANDDAATIAAGGSGAITVLANDSDSDGTIDATTVTIGTGPTCGTAVPDAVTGVVTYTNTNPACTSDAFTYTVNDNKGATSNIATVNITLTNAAPTAVADAATIAANGSGAINVLANDSDSDGTLDPTTVTIGTAPACGTAVPNPATGVVTYTNTDPTCTSDSFIYTVRDNKGAASNAATVSITLSNIAPTAVDDAAAISANGSGAINVLTNDSDSDGTLDATTVTIGTAPTCGTAVPDAVTGVVTYTNTNTACASDSFTYTVNDNKGATSNAATVTITITNDAPVANDDTYTTNEDQTLNVPAPGVLGNDTDANGNPLSAVVNVTPTHGTLVLNADGSFTYDPNPGFFGVDTFTYHATDGTDDSADATVTINVALLNGTLIANDDGADMPMNTSITLDVLANDVDPEGDPLHIAQVTQPLHGQAVVQNGRIVYTPVVGFVGSDTFVYTAADDFGASDTATVWIGVWQPVPLCADFDGSTNEIIHADVPGGTVTNGSVFCRVLTENAVFVRPSAEVGRPDVLSRGVIQAVDVFALYHDGSSTALFNNPITVCLRGEGAFLYLDATVSPRSMVELPVFMQSGYTCASVPNAGTVVLVGGAASVVNPAPSSPDSTGPVTPLSDCMVTTRHILNLRAEASDNAAILRMIPYNVTLTALERTSAWFHVDYLGERGWISAGFVTPQGTCG